MVDKRKMKIQRILSVITIFISFVLILPDFNIEVKKSIWSVNYVKYILGTDQHISKECFQAESIHPRSRIWLAREALEKDDPSKARSLIHPLLGTGNKEALQMLGRILWSQGSYEEAVQVWMSQGEFVILIQNANKMVADGNMNTALVAYKAAYEVDPQIGTLPLANFYWLQLGDMENAEYFLRKSINEYPSSPNYISWLTRLGDVSKAQNKWDQAENAYRLSLQHQESYEAYLGLGWVYYFRDQRMETALDAFQKAIDLDKDNGEGYFAIGQLFMNENQYESAERWFSKAIEFNPDQPWYYIERANAVRSRGEYSKAVSLYIEAINRFPNFGPLYYELAWAYRLDNKLIHAISSINQALDLMSPPNAQYFLRAGMLHELANNNEKALEMYKEGLRIDPENVYIQQNIRRIENEENIAP